MKSCTPHGKSDAAAVFIKIIPIGYQWAAQGAARR